MILDVFNDVLGMKEGPPDTWKRTRLVVIFKKSDPTLPKNYRPIASLRILYKLFSRMVCNRLTPIIMTTQGVEQAAYRKGFSTVDHLLTTVLVIERSWEFKVPLWIAMVDFEKAFDTVEHEPLWRVLRSNSVPEHYIHLLAVLYSEQKGVVKTDVQSNEFSISRGVKQGDPLSALLFIAIMQDCLGKLEKKWHHANKRRKGDKFGLDISEEGPTLTNLRFADDILLMAQSKQDVRKMLEHLQALSAEYGLKINVEKTKILTWNHLSNSNGSVMVGGQNVEILDEDMAERYLGRQLCFQGSQEEELRNRIAAGWCVFHKHKAELCSKHYPTSDRARLFQAVVTPVVLYACATWALTAQQETKLHTVWRKMLRYTFRLHRRKDEQGELEDWIDYIRRSAHEADGIAAKFGLESWSRSYRRTKWRYARKVALYTDNRWCHKVLRWMPQAKYSRDPGRPRTRWSDSIEKMAGGNWMEVASDQNLWASLEDGFVYKLHT